MNRPIMTRRRWLAAGMAGSAAALATTIWLRREAPPELGVEDADVLEGTRPGPVSLHRIARVRLEPVTFVEWRNVKHLVNGAARRLAWSPDGRRLAVSIGGSSAVVVDTTTWQPVQRFDSKTGPRERAMAFLSTSALMVDPADDYAADFAFEVRDPDNGRLIRRIARPSGFERHATSSITVTSSRRFAVASVVRDDDTRLLLFDMASDVFRGELAVPSRFESYVLASGPGDRLAAAVDSASSFGREHFTDTGIYRLDTATNTFECAMAGHPDLAKCLAWSPDGGLIASGTGGFYGGLGAPIVGLTPVPLWRVEDGRMISSFVSETESIDKLAWHPSSAILATSHDRDETVRLWSIPERRMIFEISVPQPKSVYALSFHPTNGHLVWGRAGAVDVFEIRGLG